MTELVLPNDANFLGNLLGGRLLHWIDIAGALTASRHCESGVATVVMDAVIFKHPIRVGGIVTLKSYVTWTGNTSLEVAVEVNSEDVYTGVKQFINKVYLVFVCLGKNGVKAPVPPIIPQTEEEKADWEAAARRRGKA
jgi:acyl-CoA hydrolase